VFDPLAVLLLIASQYTFAYHRGGNTPPTGGKDDDPEDPKEDPEQDNVAESESQVDDRTDDSEPVATTDREETVSVEATPTDPDRADTPRSGGTEEEKASLVDETIKQMKQDEQWWQDEKSLAGQVKVDDEGKVVTEDVGTVEVEAPAMREYQSATGERVKIKADLLEPKKPQVKEKNLEDMIRGADEDVLERVYKEMVTEGNTNQTIKSEGEDTEKKLEENTHWLPLQRKQ
jgi:hypothetical protein